MKNEKRGGEITMVPVEKRILIKAASMYYLDHMKQSEIARHRQD